MLFVLVLTGCLPYEGLPADTPQIVNARYVGCTVDAISEIQRPNGNWRDYFTRRSEYDQWGNLVYDLIDDADSPNVYEMTAEYRGEWLDRRDITDDFTEGGLVSSEVRTWDGIFLVQAVFAENDDTTRVTYTNDGVNPYTSSEADDGDDGELDRASTFEWDDGNIVGIQVDEALDGTIDQTRTLAYDSEGRYTRDDLETRDQYQYIEAEWGGPHDNLLDYRQETGEIDGPSSTFRLRIIWDDGWTSSETEQRTDGETLEVNVETFDDQGRLLTRTRDFPEQNVNPTRETWTWDCP